MSYQAIGKEAWFIVERNGKLFTFYRLPFLGGERLNEYGRFSEEIALSSEAVAEICLWGDPVAYPLREGIPRDIRFLAAIAVVE